MNRPQEPSLPQDRDIVVTREPASAGRYILHEVAGKGQLSYLNHGEATSRALSYARLARVDAWYTEDGRTFQRIGQFRQ